MGLLHLLRNQLGLHLGQQRTSVNERLLQLCKIAEPALDHCQKSGTVIDRVAVSYRPTLLR